MPNLVNRLVVQELTREVGDAEGILVVSFGGLTVKETESLRGKLAQKGVKLRMIRNSLAARVLKGRDLEPEGGWSTAIAGNTAIAYGQAEAAIVAAKVFTSPEVKKAGKVSIRAGVLEGRVLSARDSLSLAGIPDKNTLRAQLLGVLSGPARGLVTVLAASPTGVARVIDAHAKKLEASAPPAVPAVPAAPDATATPEAPDASATPAAPDASATSGAAQA